MEKRGPWNLVMHAWDVYLFSGCTVGLMKARSWAQDASVAKNNRVIKSARERSIVITMSKSVRWLKTALAKAVVCLWCLLCVRVSGWMGGWSVRVCVFACCAPRACVFVFVCVCVCVCVSVDRSLISPMCLLCFVFREREREREREWVSGVCRFSVFAKSPDLPLKKKGSRWHFEKKVPWKQCTWEWNIFSWRKHFPKNALQNKNDFEEMNPFVPCVASLDKNRADNTMLFSWLFNLFPTLRSRAARHENKYFVTGPGGKRIRSAPLCKPMTISEEAERR